MFEVDTVGLVGCAQSIDDVASTLNRLESRLRGVQINSAMAGKSYGSIVSSVVSVARTYSGKAGNARNLAGATRSIAKLYADTENNIVNTSRSLLAISVKSQAAGKGGSNGTQSSVGSSSGKQSGKGTAGNPIISEHGNQFFEFVEKIFSYFDSNKDGSPNGNGITSGLLAYLRSLINMFDVNNWKNNGYQELGDLASDSVGFLDPVYKVLGDADTSGWLGGLSSGTGIYATLMGLLEGNYGTSREFFNDWGDSAVKLLSMADPSFVVSACVGGGWGIIRALYSCYEKYIQPNGKLDYWEIEPAISMIAISSGIGIVEGGTKGIVSQKTLGFTYEEAAEKEYERMRRIRREGDEQEFTYLRRKLSEGTITASQYERLTMLEDSVRKNLVGNQNLKYGDKYPRTQAQTDNAKAFEH